MTKLVNNRPVCILMIESTGWLYTLKLLKNSFLAITAPHHHTHNIQWQLSKGNTQLSIDDKTDRA
ncbi:hypothetical protein [Pseudoalteromonas sp. H105]|jgi:hypothetical protein|uniref:hypothetical protein n=1 Tax=Pseudoalteromonas sp. H105 TaxID=1348393 RepID=UPI0007322EE1|nr:hypothetical protein [Pseudoalteromonas sp. H105]KTF13006.1 hypothetical protein ATS75_16435 [Pseudoalteromonas sp. H105]